MGPITQLLDAAAGGDTHAAQELLPLVYDELRQLAASYLAREEPGHTLPPTALVHEAYLRLVGDAKPPAAFNHRGHFFGAAAQAMRRILVDSARRKGRHRHGGDYQRVEMPADGGAAPEMNEDLVALDAALTKLAVQDPVKAKLVELRYFAGLSGDDAAEALGISPSTADRHWVFARAWLRRELDGLPADQQKE